MTRVLKSDTTVHEYMHTYIYTYIHLRVAETACVHLVCPKKSVNDDSFALVVVNMHLCPCCEDAECVYAILTSMS